MRDALSPLQMAKWRAFRKIQPDQMDRVCDILKKGFAAVANSMGAKFDEDDFEPVEDKKRPPPVTRPLTAAEIGVVPNGNSNR